MARELARFRSDEKSNPLLISNCDSSVLVEIHGQAFASGLFSFRGRDLQADPDVKSST